MRESKVKKLSALDLRLDPEVALALSEIGGISSQAVIGDIELRGRGAASVAELALINHLRESGKLPPGFRVEQRPRSEAAVLGVSNGRLSVRVPTLVLTGLDELAANAALSRSGYAERTLISFCKSRGKLRSSSIKMRGKAIVAGKRIR